MRKIICLLLGHRWRVRSALPKNDSAFQVAAWVEADYDFYQVCDRCSACEGVGERYD